MEKFNSMPASNPAANDVFSYRKLTQQSDESDQPEVEVVDVTSSHASESATFDAEPTVNPTARFKLNKAKMPSGRLHRPADL